MRSGINQNTYENKIKRQVRDEDIIALYVENLTPEEIADRLKRPMKRILKALSKFGVCADDSKTRKFQKSDIPFGWNVTEGKLAPDDGEQWVLQKVSFELKNGKKAEEIVTLFKKIGIKPRGGVWHAERFSRDQKLNGRLLSAWSKNQSGWKELESAEVSDPNELAGFVPTRS